MFLKMSLGKYTTTEFKVHFGIFVADHGKKMHVMDVGENLEYKNSAFFKFHIFLGSIVSPKSVQSVQM